MRKYEIMFIVKPDLEEGAVKSVFDSVKTLLEEQKANIVEAKEMGQKELAYEINGFKTGYYYLINIESKDAKAINEFDRLALISEDVIRHLIVKIED